MRPRLLLICGPNGAGKSTFSRALSIQENIIVIDPDRLAADGMTPLEAGKAAIRLSKRLLAEGVSFAKESTLTSKFDFSLVEEAKKRGYTVEMVYIRLANQEIALGRVARRKAGGGHGVPEKDVLRRFHRSLANLEKAASLVDKLTIVDNSASRCRAYDALARKDDNG